MSSSSNTGTRMLRELLKKQSIVYPVLKYMNQTYLETYYHVIALLKTTPGLNTTKRDVPVVVSLTTIPERINKAYLTIESLLLQSIRPDYIILWISDMLAHEAIPSSLNRQKRRGLTIEFRRDVGPHTKIIHSLREYKNSIIVTADDDHFYMKNWLKQLYDAYIAEPFHIYCHRAYLMKAFDGKPGKYSDWKLLGVENEGPLLSIFPTGVGGVLYPPESLHEEVCNVELFTKLCPTADDIWLKAMSLLKRTKCVKVGDYSGRAVQIKGMEHRALKLMNIVNEENDVQIQRVFEYYNLFNTLDE